MSEWGHTGVIGHNVCLDAWGWGPFVIAVDGKSYRFSDSDRFGPHLISKRGDILSNQPGERSPFWAAHRAWVRQGRQVRGGECVWTQLRPTKVYVRKAAGRWWVARNEPGDEGGEEIYIKEAAE